MYLIMVIDLHPPKHVPYNGNRSTSPKHVPYNGNRSTSPKHVPYNGNRSTSTQTCTL